MRSIAAPLLASVLLVGLQVFSLARDVRIATFNIKSGVGSVGSLEYNAARETLQRIDADVVAFQELNSGDKPNWDAMATELGYSHTAFADLGPSPLNAGIRGGYYSRFPILSTFNVTSPQNCDPPTVVKELARLPFRAVIDVPGAEHPLVLWNLHQKASSGIANEFRRAVEAIRTADDIDDYLSMNPLDEEFIVLGDLNEDVSETQASQITSLPSGLPASYQLGCDITFPIPYAVFPEDAYEVAGSGMHVMDAFQEDSTDEGTLIVSGRRVDYIFVSSNLWTSPLGTPAAEVYNSAQDDGAGGLPKWGSALPAGTSADASDHYTVFIDIFMQDKVVNTSPIGGITIDGTSVHVKFQSTNGVLYTIEFCGDLAATHASWTAVTDFIDVPGTGGLVIYTDDGAGTRAPPTNAAQRFYRIVHP